MKKIYLAGAMAGVDNYIEVFHNYAEYLKEDGWFVFNPSTMIGEYKDCLAYDLNWICKQADAIAMIPKWELSKGAQVEWRLAIALGLEIIYLE